MQNNCSREEVTYAGFWVRLMAYAIDNIIVFTVLLVVRLLLSGLMTVLSGTVLGGNVLFQYSLKDVILYIFQVMYFILFIYCTGTTPGKRLLNLRVVSAQENASLTLLNVIYRETVGRFLCSISIGIGYMIAGFDRQKRGLHDILCDTRVIYAKKVKVYPDYRGQAQPEPQPLQLNPQQVQPEPQPVQPELQPSHTERPLEPQQMPDYAGPYRMVRPNEEIYNNEEQKERNSYK
ncbi:RDD family protein [Faecalicatena contorta]|uniref:RDD family protein n=1 Tax=Faecalicatena contorta TaxID=39482 RepID=UPI001F2BA0EB|nr:RDD family protein [Faecalicatena contorta]MCF2554796.1 RDD family protein [Faecalicatena contorta]